MRSQRDMFSPKSRRNVRRRIFFEKYAKNFAKSINEGLQFVEKNDAETIANVIIDQFPDTSINDLIKIVERYKEADSWLSTPYISKESFENLEDIMIESYIKKKK